MRLGQMKLGACRRLGGEGEKRGANSLGSARRMVRQKSVARKVQLVNKFSELVNK